MKTATKTREKKTVVKDITGAQAEDAFAIYNKNQSRLKEIAADIERRTTEIREEYTTEVKQLEEGSEASFAVLQTYALENADKFEKRKSVEMVHGKIGFRTSTPALKPLKGFTWPAVTKLVKEFLGMDYVRSKEEADKELLLAKRDDETVNVLFEKCGIEVRQEETFFVEPKEETIAA